MSQIKIAKKIIGKNQPCFIIAEAGVNHNGDIETARKLIKEASLAGADAVKFQTFKSENLVTSKAPKADYQLKTTDKKESQLDMLKKLEIPKKEYPSLIECCKDEGICFLSTPFDEESSDLLEELNIEAFKIPSGEITNIPLLVHIAKKNKPMIISTGMSNLGEVEKCVQIMEEIHNEKFVLLHCTTDYPADFSEVNLKAMKTMHNAFGVSVGYSDHTPGIEVSIAAVTLGACVIEKHFTLDCNMPGPDHKASIEPLELKFLIKSIRNVEKAIGNGRKQPTISEAKTSKIARKSLVASKDIPKDTVLERNMIVCKRPGTGIKPELLSYLLNRPLKKDILKDELLSFEMV